MSDNIFFTNLDDLKSNLEGEAEGRRIPLKSLAEESTTPQWYSQDYEGQLSVDVYQTPKEIVVKSTIAGVEPADLDIYLHDDLLTIRGKRSKTTEEKTANYFYEECYWGGFSRSVILPVEVDPNNISATLKNGILTIRLPKIERKKTVNIKIS
jgi:HSP20 family protein